MTRERIRVSRARSGFTLVELLTVIVIIGMLGAVSITTVRVAVRSAKETQTRTTIAKIDSVLTACYEKYQYRRVDVVAAYRYANGVNSSYGVPTLNRWTTNPETIASCRLNIVRDLLRCDFPCTPKELYTYSLFNGTSTANYTPLQAAILASVNDVLNDGNNAASVFENSPNSNAELLYLVVMNADPEARSSFSEREIADVDGNGLYEFVDGWGNPIRWMRWAPGLEASDRQPTWSEVRNGVSDLDSDPFDPMRVGNGWFLVPYVYSLGSDGASGLEDWFEVSDAMNDTAERMNDPFWNVYNNPVDTEIGDCYGLSDGTTANKDNIDNHTLVR